MSFSGKPEAAKFEELRKIIIVIIITQFKWNIITMINVSDIISNYNNTK